MHGETFIYIGSALPLLWGIAHLFPTKSIIRGFGDISTDNRRIIAMEWINEGAALIMIAVMVDTVTAIEPASPVSTAVYLISAASLIVLAGISLFTGFKIDFLPFRLCPVIFSTSALLIIFGWWLI